jgi:hypothetical protein
MYSLLANGAFTISRNGEGLLLGKARILFAWVLQDQIGLRVCGKGRTTQTITIAKGHIVIGRSLLAHGAEPAEYNPLSYMCGKRGHPQRMCSQLELPSLEQQERP